MVIIDRIVELSKERGIKLSYLAGLFGLGRTYFQDVKKRNSNIPDDRLFVIAEKLNTTPEYLKGETDQKERPADSKADELSEYDSRVLAWFHSLPPEKRQAILEIGGGPKE